MVVAERDRLLHLGESLRAWRTVSSRRNLRSGPSSSITTRDFRARERSRSNAPGHPAHGVRGVGREGAGERRQPAQQDPLSVLAEQAVAPVERRVERLLTPGSATPTGQQPEPVVQAADHLARRDVRHLGGGQLDRQRDAVEPCTPAARRWPPGLGWTRRRFEQLHGLGLSGRIGRGTERRTRCTCSPWISSASRLVARSRPTGSARGSRRRSPARLDDMLAVVHHQERTAPTGSRSAPRTGGRRRSRGPAVRTRRMRTPPVGPRRP